MSIELAKPCLDVGLFTNRLDEMRSFWGERIGLQFEEILPVGGGVRQYRYGLRGSVLKINHSREALATRQAGGYRLLRISAGVGETQRLADPDGNEIELVPEASLKQIEVVLDVSDVAAFNRFYGAALGAGLAGENRYQIGNTMLSFNLSSELKRQKPASAADAAAALAAMRAVGIGYLTIQVRDCDFVHRRALSMGAIEGAPPMTLGAVARISFIRDPDGNWIEISQRASLTGALPN